MMMDIHRFADRCFRHATLGWVSSWCAAHGKTFRLYGRGWSGHAEFKRWDAGVAEPGEQMRAIYQASRINLQLIESGFIHSRSLDGLAAGGFFLTRRVSADGEHAAALREIHELGVWLSTGEGRAITSPQEVASHPDAGIREKWKLTLAYHPWPPEHALRVLRVWADTPHACVAFPMLPEVSFHDEASFGALADRYLANDAARQLLTRQMRQILLDQFSYDSRWKQFMGAVTDGLSTPRPPSR
jgi:hypothetical protein